MEALSSQEKFDQSFPFRKHLLYIFSIILNVKKKEIKAIIWLNCNIKWIFLTFTCPPNILHQDTQENA